MEYIRTILSKNLHDLRRSKGLSQQKVAEIMGVNQSTYGRWENGDWIGSESLEKIEKLAAFYEVPSSRFFYDPDIDKIEANSTWINRPSPKEITKKLEELIQFINK